MSREKTESRLVDPVRHRKDEKGMTLEETLKKIKPLNQEAMDAAWRRWSETSIPIHSLGKLQDAVAAIAGMLGTIQAAEVLKYFTGVGELLTNRLLTFDAKTMVFHTIKVSKRESCELCGAHPTIDRLVDYELPSCDLKKH